MLDICYIKTIRTTIFHNRKTLQAGLYITYIKPLQINVLSSTKAFDFNVCQAQEVNKVFTGYLYHYCSKIQD